jgi:hypothetical protein
MMIIVANLRLSGFTSWVAQRAHRPLALLGEIVVVGGVFSAFLANDARQMPHPESSFGASMGRGRRGRPVRFPKSWRISWRATAGREPPATALR